MRIVCIAGSRKGVSMFDPLRRTELPKHYHDQLQYEPQSSNSSFGGWSLIGLLIGAIVTYVLANIAFFITFASLFNSLKLDDSWSDAIIFGVILSFGALPGIPSLFIYVILFLTLVWYQRRTGKVGGTGFGVPIFCACILTPLLIALLTIVLIVPE